MVKFETVRGMKDWYGKEAITRNYIREKLRDVFEKYGFTPIETPILETCEAIAFKGGGEIQKEVYQLKDRGGRSLALRFDQTVPLARFMSTHQGEIKIPFKRYVIGPVFRDGDVKPIQGRYKEFYQCDVDILGVSGMVAEAELFALANDAFQELGLGGVDLKINNRKLLEGILDYAGVHDKSKLPTINILDKIDKFGFDGVKEGLEFLTLGHNDEGLSNETFSRFAILIRERGIADTIIGLRPEIIAEIGIKGYEDITSLSQTDENPEELIRNIGGYRATGEPLLSHNSVTKLMEIMKIRGTNQEIYNQLKKIVSSEKGLEGIKEVGELIEMSDAMGFDFVQLEQSLARGLDYYTGTAIEVFLKDKSVIPSAIVGGGRFDDMVGDFIGEEKVPAVGFSFGLERLAIILSDNKKRSKTTTNLYLVPIETAHESLSIAHKLRQEGINIDFNMTKRRIPRLIEYADDQGIPYFGIIGKDELSKGVIRIRNMNTKEQKDVEIEKVSDFIKESIKDNNE